MTEKRPILSVRDVSKNYEIHSSNGTRFLRQLLGRFSPAKPRVFPAVRGVSFDLYPGEAIAILGRNGAGKSTLLQLLSDLLRPSSGVILAPPRIISLLELGSGFSPDFTGRENIRVNGAILGLNRSTISEKLNEIIEFADIGEYIDQPVRTYSSGMFLRLAFAIATTAAPDLLMVDEVLAVGDIFFRQKCYERLNAMRKNGTAIVLVTHSLSDASEFCDRGLVLSEGSVAYYGNSVGAVQHFIHHEQRARTGRRDEGMGVSQQRSAEEKVKVDAPGDWLEHPNSLDLSASEQIGDRDMVSLEKILITDLEDVHRTIFQQGDWMRIRAAFYFKKEAGRVIAGVGLRNEKNILVHGKHGINLNDRESPSQVPCNTRLELSYDVKLDLDFGEYTFDLGVAEVDDNAFKRRQTLTAQQIASDISMMCSIHGAGAISVIANLGGIIATYSHVGIADLPSEFRVKLTSTAGHEGI
ncbi:ABC transporter ATP-binding protein [Rhizobium sp. L245/93]|uniref:ABC transporter ATP-binding protein n=1 Tax=Rhizobium sp. L245/93 TaxID=2819998 RepID=UPI001ADCDDF9|nr:ABC transporter ATP-binding protein [Rhizobium sp. L245/93]MBO9170440.1 ABC transporter ATP-binding protein [Rhizobium sp. L245/93]